MEKPICNSPRGKARTSRFVRVFALARKVATSATLPAVWALAGASGALTALGDGLPAEYQQLEYIKATGNCQVRTGVTPASTDKVEMRFRPDAVGATQNLWCSRDGSGTSHQFTAFLLDSKKVRFDRNEGAAAQITSTDTLLACTNYLVVADYGTLEAVVTNVADGAEVVNVTMASGDYTPGSDLCLFASHSTGPTAGLGNYGSYRLYSFKLSDASGTLRLDLVPAKRVEDGVVGLYDAKNDTFLTNSLSGSRPPPTGRPSPPARSRRTTNWSSTTRRKSPSMPPQQSASSPSTRREPSRSRARTPSRSPESPTRARTRLRSTAPSTSPARTTWSRRAQ